MSYQKTNWSTGDIITREKINNMEDGIETVSADVEDLKIAVQDINDNYDVMDARVDSLVAIPSGSTTENAELLDIRVGADGTTYTTAGKAVRDQLNAIKDQTGGLEEAVDGFQEDITDIKDALTDMDGKIAASLITNTASGAIASFPDGADSVPVGDLTVQIEPVQDLHGQSNPYPAGGGANILPYPFRQTTITNNGITYTDNGDGSLTLNGTSTGTSTFILWSPASISAGQTLSVASFRRGTASGTVGIYDRVSRLQESGSGSTVTYTTDYAQDFRIEMASGVTCTNYVIRPVFVLGSTLPSAYIPYENICPISGWTGANVVRTGKNLLNLTESGMISQGWNRAFAMTMKAGVYTLSCQNQFGANDTTYGQIMQFNDADNNIVKRFAANYNFGDTEMVETITLTEPEASRVAYLLIQPKANNMPFSQIANAQLQLEPGSTATAYEPYQSNTYSVDWTDEAGTVYGGTLDVTTGVLTVDSELEVFNTESNGLLLSQINSLNKNSGGISTVGDYTRISFAVRDSVDQSKYNRISSTYTVKMCNIAPHEFAYNSATLHWYRNSILYLFLPTSLVGSTPQSVYDYLVSIKDVNPLTLVIPLVTPITYHLTPQEVTTLLGQNNIWADCGDTTVDYRANTKLYIEKLTAPTEDDMTANNNIPNGTYFMIGNNLYLSTTTIPAGDTINPGTNCTLMNLAAALNAINA